MGSGITYQQLAISCELDPSISESSITACIGPNRSSLAVLVVPSYSLYHSMSQLTFMHRRWKEIWARHVQNAVFVAVLCEYTRSKKLLSIKECSETIGCTLISCKFSSSRNNSPPVQSEWKDRVYLQVEDYLHGLVSVVNELSRLAVNSVTLHNYEEPFKISDFVKDVFAGFSMVCQPQIPVSWDPRLMSL